ncbi:MAG: two-component system, chemotaxis family, CheB/CheR fusion protein [Chthoniobacter sp.]|jgi:PAS domain S-box-containing protein|nr:two-component system, chemotaxis family, CheB/CheR fusion protein [Chthoniobacter sp.]
MSLEQEASARNVSNGHHLTPSSIVATVFFDRELRLIGYTPNAAEICRVLPHAVGQPLSDFRHQLEYPDLHADAERVLADRAAVEREVRGADGRYFLARLLPHFGSGEAIAGVVLTFVEVTALKRAAEICAFLAAIVQSSEDSIISIDFGGKITSWNAAAERLYGYPAREALGKPLTMLTLPEDVAQVLRNVDRIKHSKDVETFDTVRIHKDGRELSLSITLSPVKNYCGEVIGVSTIARDISARRGAEAALVVSEEQFRRAIEDAPIPVIMHAEDGQVLQVSKAWTALTGYAPEDIPTLDAWLSHAHGTWGNEVRKRIQQLFRGEARQLDTELDLATQTGERRSWVFSASMPGTLRDGRRFIVGMALDITERKNAEEALRESQERMRLIVDNAREYAIFSMDLDRRITSWNAGAKRILGYTQEEAIGQPGDIIFTGEDRAAGAPEREAGTALREGRASDERWHLRKDGSRFWGSGVMTSMHDAHGAAVGLVKIFRDHTEKLQAKEALEKSLQETERARAEAEAAGKAKDHFLAVLSHELRTPLTPVLMSVDTLMLRTDLPAQVVEGLDTIQRNVTLEAQFIDELLDLTRISRGKFELSLEPINLHEAIRLAAEVTAPDVKEKSQRLVCELEAATDHLTGDFKRLQQVFWNLLKNASKFTPERGRITVRSRNEPAAAGAPPRIVVEVSDTGIGFESDSAERIFDAFTQANETITQEFGGLGLGLAISKATVDAHQGTISAQSAGANQGATFTVCLPLAEPPTIFPEVSSRGIAHARQKK